MQLELAVYRARNGKEPFKTWYDGLVGDHLVFNAVTQRLSRLRAGNFGDCRRVGRKGAGPRVIELRIHVGPGYRVYCARVSATTALLLGGGTKRRQSKDIATAQQRLADYKARIHGKKT
jgi:putative addiction module killer protein